MKNTFQRRDYSLSKIGSGEARAAGIPDTGRRSPGFLLALCLGALVVLPTACVQTKLQTNDVIFTTTRFFWNGKIGEASVSTNGTVTLREYRSEAEKIAEAVARGVAQGMSPTP